MSVVHIEPRTGRSSALAKHLRQEGFLPMAIVHPHGDNELIKAPMSEVQRALHETPGVGIMQVQAPDEKPRTVIVKHVDYEPVTRAVIHMTLQEVHHGDTIRISVPIVAKGTCRAEELGEAVLTRPNHHVRVEAHLDDVPTEIDVDISKLEVGKSITAGDIEAPPKVRILTDPHEALFFLKPATKIHTEPKPKVADTTEHIQSTEQVEERTQED